MNPNSLKNLKPPTHEQAVARGRKGGKASGVAKRRKKLIAAVFRYILDGDESTIERREKARLKP